MKSFSTIAQNLEGSWAMVVPLDTYMSIKAPIIKVKDGLKSVYSWDVLEFECPFEVNFKEMRIKECSRASDLEIVNEHRYRQSINSNQKKKQYVEYVRLMPTEINTSIEATKSRKYDHFAAPIAMLPYHRITFDVPLESEEVQQVMGKDKSMYRMYKLEKLEDTYFIVLYSSGRPGWVFPIKEINEYYLLIYGIPYKNKMIRLYSKS